MQTQLLQAVEVMAVGEARRLGQAQARQAGEQDGQGHMELEPSQRRADTGGIEPVGIGIGGGVAVGGTDQLSDLVAAL